MLGQLILPTAEEMEAARLRQTFGLSNDPRASFHESDFLPLENRSRYEKAFSRTPYLFHFAFYLRGTSIQLPRKRRFDDPQAIGSVICNNANSRDRISFTPWILVHRLGHAIQANRANGDPNANAKAEREISAIFYAALCQAAKEFESMREIQDWEGLGGDGVRVPFQQMMTTRCCTVGNGLVNPLDVFAELLAQFVICGSVKLKMPDSLRLPSGESVEAKRVDLHLYEEKMNSVFHRVLQSLVGKTIAF